MARVAVYHGPKFLESSGLSGKIIPSNVNLVVDVGVFRVSMASRTIENDRDRYR